MRRLIPESFESCSSERYSESGGDSEEVQGRTSVVAERPGRNAGRQSPVAIPLARSLIGGGSYSSNIVASVGVSGRGARTALLADLRARIAKIEQHPLRLPPSSPPEQGCLPSASGSAAFSVITRTEVQNRATTGWYLGIEEIDRLLPAGGLQHAGLHEIKSEQPGDALAALGFALGLGALRWRQHLQAHGMAGGMVWVQSLRDAGEYGHIYAPGLLPFGLDPAGLIVVEPKTPTDALWAIEESLKGDDEQRGPPLAFVLASIAASSCSVAGRRSGQRRMLDVTAQRRLALAAARGETPCLLLTSHASPGLESAHTRWLVGRRPSRGPAASATVADAWPASSPSARARAAPVPSLFPARGHGRMQVRLTRCRGAGAMLEGEGRNFDLEWCDEAYCFRLVAPLADRAPGIADACPESGPDVRQGTPRWAAEAVRRR